MRPTWEVRSKCSLLSCVMWEKEPRKTIVLSTSTPCVLAALPAGTAAVKTVHEPFAKAQTHLRALQLRMLQFWTV